MVVYANLLRRMDLAGGKALEHGGSECPGVLSLSLSHDLPVTLVSTRCSPEFNPERPLARVSQSVQLTLLTVAPWLAARVFRDGRTRAGRTADRGINRAVLQAAGFLPSALMEGGQVDEGGLEIGSHADTGFKASQ